MVSQNLKIRVYMRYQQRSLLLTIVCTPLPSPLFLGDHNSDTCVLEGVSIDEALGDSLGKAIDLLDLLRGNVFTL